MSVDQNQDADHLRLLSIFHYVVAGMVGVFSLFPLIHLAMGVAILMGAFDDGGQGGPPPDFVGWLFVVFPLIWISLGLTLATCITVAGRKLGRRTGHTYCLVIAGIECCFLPFGTVLGVLTILVLLRPSVKTSFGLSADGASANAAGNA